jgi:hypothetical protein
MSRLSIVLILILVALIGLVVLLASVNTEVPPTRIEKAMLNEAPPQ